MIRQAATVISPTIEAREALVSSETAISCLALLGSQIGVGVETEKLRLRQRRQGATLAISELIELANDIGFRAQYVHRDWSWLSLTVAIQPVVLLLKNGNTIVALGVGRTGAAEILVSDPLHRGGALIILSRESIERAWDGDAVTIAHTPPIFQEVSIRATTDAISAKRTMRVENSWKIFTSITFCLSFVLVAAALITLPFTYRSVISQTKALLSPAALPPRSAALPLLIEPTPQPSDLESAAMASIAPTPASIAEVSGGPSLPISLEHQANTLGKDLPSSVNAATGLAIASSGPAQADIGSGLQTGPELSAADLVVLLARGDDQLRMGDVASARLFYERAADAGEANAALRLGETFDPIFLERANLRGIVGDMGKALFWYIRARDLGSNEANQLLKDLDQSRQADPKHL